MSGEKTTRRVVRMLLPWNDEKEERYLMEQARSGWRLTEVTCFGYRFERAAPAEVAYRYDVRPSRRQDLDEYLSLFRDAGWEHVGRRGLWYLYRKPVTEGRVPEIYTDNASRAAKYRRILAFMGIMMCVVSTQISIQSSRQHFGWVTVLELGAVGFFLYFIIRVVLRMRAIRNEPTPQG